jgi:hypothetical protein
LTVPRDASKAQIKKAYKTLSKIYHPDKNPGDQGAKDKFVELSDGKGSAVFNTSFPKQLADNIIQPKPMLS